MSDVVATRELIARSTWWCIVESRFPSDSFNPNAAGDPADEEIGGRFHPFESAAGVRVPTKYLSDHETGAFAETLMRDDRGPDEVTLDEVSRHRLVRLALRRTLRVIDLVESTSADEVRAWLREGREAYPPLRTVAATLHADDAGLDGLLWEGRQLDRPGMNCVVLFGDRVRDTDLEVIEELRLDDGPGVRLLRAAARGRGLVLPDALVLGRT